MFVTLSIIVFRFAFFIHFFLFLNSNTSDCTFCYRGEHHITFPISRTQNSASEPHFVYLQIKYSGKNWPIPEDNFENFSSIFLVDCSRWKFKEKFSVGLAVSIGLNLRLAWIEDFWRVVKKEIWGKTSLKNWLVFPAKEGFFIARFLRQEGNVYYLRICWCLGR